MIGEPRSIAATRSKPGTVSCSHASTAVLVETDQNPFAQGHSGRCPPNLTGRQGCSTAMPDPKANQAG